MFIPVFIYFVILAFMGLLSVFFGYIFHWIFNFSLDMAFILGMLLNGITFMLTGRLMTVLNSTERHEVKHKEDDEVYTLETVFKNPRGIYGRSNVKKKK